MYQIQLLNKISPAGLSRLDPKNYLCTEEMENPDAILVRSANMHNLEIPSSLKAVARAGAGTNNIPVEEYSKKGIVVFNTPGGNANAVKELVIESLLLSSRKVYGGMQWVQTLKGQGADVPVLTEKEKSKFTGPEIAGKTLGVIGLGAIGTKVCHAALALGMNVYGYDPYLSIDSAWGMPLNVKHAVTLMDIFSNCDYITLHVPLTKETKEMIHSESIATMKDGVRILNFSRAELVNNADIIEAVSEKKVYVYVTDFPQDELLGHNGILVMPHLGASTPESEENCARMAADQLKNFLEHGNIRNSVNLPSLELPYRGLPRIAVIHENKPNMIANITGALGENINNLTNNSRGEYAYTMLDLDKSVSESISMSLTQIPGIIRVTQYH